MTLTTFQKLLSELLAQYNEEAENHSIINIELTSFWADPTTLAGSPKIDHYEIEIKTTGK